MTENKLILDKHILILNGQSNIDNFCGLTINKLEELKELNVDDSTLIYLCNNNNDLKLEYLQNIPLQNIYIVKDIFTNYNEYNNLGYNLITIGEVPINIHNVGILFKHFFTSENDIFESLCKEHTFQTLTESNKDAISYRTGLYITNVQENMKGEILFNLLRCSTNLSGSTDNFRDTDYTIIEKVNNISKYFFEQKVDLNHVLAQIYVNSKINNKQIKATIKQHSDKTKDMPKNALIAFCTFYKNYQNDNFSPEELKKFKKSKKDKFDYCYNNTSVLTCLRFKLKKMVTDENLTKQFDVILYPNSVFLISLNTNRLYTHEIIPSVLPVDNIPTRLGYVIRCSTTKAIFKDNQTFIIDNEYIKLEEPNMENFKEIKDKYYLENLTDEIVHYNDIYYSLNKGDYTKPNL